MLDVPFCCCLSKGSAADIAKAAMIRVAAVLRGLEGARLLLQIHDELLLEVPASGLHAAAESVREAMESAAALEGVPLTVKMRTGVYVMLNFFGFY